MIFVTRLCELVALRFCTSRASINLGIAHPGEPCHGISGWTTGSSDNPARSISNLVITIFNYCGRYVWWEVLFPHDALQEGSTLTELLIDSSVSIGLVTASRPYYD